MFADKMRYFVSVSPDDSWVSIYIYSLKQIMLEVLAFEIYKESNSETKIILITKSIQNYMNAYLGGLLNGLVEDTSFINEIRLGLKHISNLKLAESWTVTSNSDLTIIDTVLDRIDLESTFIIHKCTEKDVNTCLWYPFVYSSNFHAKDIRMNGRCYICSRGMIVRISDPVLPTELSSREVYICPRCGIIQDKPSGFYDVFISCSDYVSIGDTLSVKVDVKNVTSETVRIKMGISVNGTGKYEIRGNQSQASLVLAPYGYRKRQNNHYGWTNSLSL